MQRYAELLRTELTARGHVVELIRPEPKLGRLKPGAHGLGKWLGYIDKFVIFPVRLRWIVRHACRASSARASRASGFKSPDSGFPASGLVVHICDHSNAMYTAHLRGVPHVVTCHDLLAVRSALGHFPQNPTGWTGKRLQTWIASGLRRASRIICVSHETRRQLLALPGFSGKTIEVVANGLNHPYHPLTEAESHARFVTRPEIVSFVDRPYVFFIGGTQWYKNRAGVLRIFLRYAEANPVGADLLFAGKPYTPADEAILNAAAPELRARIHHVGSPDNEGLHALYARAGCLLFPSLEEGFGWPLIEAMSSGCPVLTSNRPPMNEICGAAAAYLDPLDEVSAGTMLQYLLGETIAAREARVQLGLRQSAAFSTASMLEGLLFHYRAASKCG